MTKNENDTPVNAAMARGTPQLLFGAELLAWLAPDNDQPLFMFPSKPMMESLLKTRTV